METIKVSDVIIPEHFGTTTPRKEKIDSVRKYYVRHGTLDKPIVINDKNILTDNYIRYLVAKENGLTEVPYITTHEYMESLKKNIIYTYVVGLFDNYPKEYTWILKRNIPIRIGDRILVSTKSVTGKKSGVVTVVKVYQSNEYINHKSVIKNLSLEKDG